MRLLCVLVLVLLAVSCSGTADSNDAGMEGDWQQDTAADDGQGQSDLGLDYTDDMNGWCEVPQCDDTGTCEGSKMVPEGESCGAGACGSTLTCQAGDCVPDLSPCDDEDPCTEDSCNLDGECDHDPYTGGELRCGTGACENIVAQCVAGVLQTCTPKEAGVETCDGVDNDCTGTVDDNIPDIECGDGLCKVKVPGCLESQVPVCTPDAGAATNETCNGKDDDCNGVVDDPGTPGCQPYLLDNDGDGFSNSPTDYQCLCNPTAPYTALVDGDCDDDNATANPEGTEHCNGFDDNCDGATDEPETEDCKLHYLDSDVDGYGVDEDSKCLCAPDGMYSALEPGDCDDSTGQINPGIIESCGGFDDDCDGFIDEEGADGCFKYYFDGDSDGYGVASETDYHCLCKISQDFPKYTTKNTGDCCDLDSRVRPYNTVPGKTISLCNTWDFDCNNIVEKEYPDSGICDMELVTCHVEQYGFVGGFVECGVAAAYLMDCTYDWGVCAKSTETRTQGCL